MHFLFAFLLGLLSLMLILLVLVQRGRGGGLTGALGGMGGQSAFGTKAGDTFTRLTIGGAAIWILLAIVSVKLLGGGSGKGKLGDANLGAESSASTSAPSGLGTGAVPNPLDSLPSAPVDDGGSSDEGGSTAGSVTPPTGDSGTTSTDANDDAAEANPE